MNSFFKSDGKIVPSEKVLQTYKELAERIIDGRAPGGKSTELAVKIQKQRLQLINTALKNMQ